MKNQHIEHPYSLPYDRQVRSRGQLLLFARAGAVGGYVLIPPLKGVPAGRWM